MNFMNGFMVISMQFVLLNMPFFLQWHEYCVYAHDMPDILTPWFEKWWVAPWQSLAWLAKLHQGKVHLMPRPAPPASTNLENLSPLFGQGVGECAASQMKKRSQNGFQGKRVWFFFWEFSFNTTIDGARAEIESALRPELIAYTLR